MVAAFRRTASALNRIAADAGYDFELLKAAIDVNLAQFERVVDKVEELVGAAARGSSHRCVGPDLQGQHR